MPGALQNRRRIAFIVPAVVLVASGLLLARYLSKGGSLAWQVPGGGDTGPADRRGTVHKARGEQGHWFYARSDIREKLRQARGDLTDAQREEMRRLEAIGYLAGTAPAAGRTSVTTYDEARAWRGYNLYCSGHGPEAVLMDMHGTELHRWRYDITRALPDFTPPSRDDGHEHLFWRRVQLLEDGDLLTIVDGQALLKLDAGSELEWVYDGNPHHDMFVTEDGRIYVLTRHAVIDPRFDPRHPILEDFICILSPQGEELECVSLLAALRGSHYAPILHQVKGYGDIFHTNTVEVLDGRLAGRHPAFKRGNVLISINNLSFVGVVDMEQERVVWGLSGLWHTQHQPTVLDSGRLLVFDNRFVDDSRSRVIEIDPLTQEVAWEYMGTPADPFFSFTCGTAERLSNGNTLITESNAGRAFEVSPDGRIVWEFINPYTAGEGNELIATLFEVIRLPPETPLDWLKEGSALE